MCCIIIIALDLHDFLKFSNGNVQDVENGLYFIIQFK